MGIENDPSFTEALPVTKTLSFCANMRMVASETGSFDISSISLPDIEPLSDWLCAFAKIANVKMAINIKNSFFIVDIVISS